MVIQTTLRAENADLPQDRRMEFRIGINLGDVMEAAFQKALDINRQYQLPYFEAKTLFEWGQIYLSPHGSGDRDRGMHLLDEALGIFQKIQSEKMVEKVLAQKQMLEA